MKIILKQSVDKLGDIGDVVEVANGYARNFLLPRGIAEVSTPGKIARLQVLKEKQHAQLEKEKEQLQMLAEKLQHTSCTITMPAGEEDKLYGAVTTANIAKVLAEDGIDIPKKKIVLEEPIKKLGIYNVPVKLSPELSVSFKLWVVKE